LNIVIEDLHATLSSSITDTDGITICDECGNDEVAEGESNALTFGQQMKFQPLHSACKTHRSSPFQCGFTLLSVE